MLAAMGKEPGEFVGETTAAVKRLDSAVREYRLPAPQVIKIDVEGRKLMFCPERPKRLPRFGP
jgi:hypothetical protein